MTKNLCFILESQQLFLDKILVDYNTIPLFYTCKDLQNNYYIVLSTDIEDEKYFIVRTTTEKIFKLLSQQITMRNIITSENYYWEVTVGESIAEDISKYRAMSQIDKSALPIEDSYFTLATQDLQKYRAHIIDLIYPRSDEWIPIESYKNTYTSDEETEIIEETVNIETKINEYFQTIRTDFAMITEPEKRIESVYLDKETSIIFSAEVLTEKLSKQKTINSYEDWLAA